MHNLVKSYIASKLNVSNDRVHLPPNFNPSPYDFAFDKNLFLNKTIKTLSGIPPLSFKSKGKPLTAWSITGNTVQNGTPTPENPVEVLGCGDYDSETGLYKIPVATSADGTEPITTPIYLDSPLYKIGNYADSRGMTEEVRVVKELVLTGKEGWYYMPNYDVENTVRFHSIEILPDRKETMLDLCSHFERMDYSSLNVANKPAFSIANRTQLVFRVSKAEGSIATYFSSYLAAQYAAGTPVKVYYVMRTPETKTVEPVEIPTLNGTTVIDVDTAVKPENMTIKYKG